jgi:hypothetical protein
METVIKRKWAFSLKTLLVVLGLLAVSLGWVVRWHSRSMTQFHELNRIWQRDMWESTPGVLYAHLEDEVEINEDTGLLEFVGLGSIEEERGGLCRFIDFRYLLTTPLVWVNEPTVDSENQVSRLKGVRQIVIFGDLDADVLQRWKKRFPRAKILTSEEAGIETNYGPGGIGRFDWIRIGDPVVAARQTATNVAAFSRYSRS